MWLKFSRWLGASVPLALTGSMTAVQFCYPAELPLNVNKNEHFSKVSFQCFFNAIH